MIKLFRKARKNLLSENKFTRYLVYAFGEIVLLVIGILAALQINSMNQENQRSKLEKVLLSQFRFEILDIYQDIWRDTENLELGMRSHYRIYDHITRDLPYNDSLCFDFYWLKVDEYTYPTNAVFTRLNELGLDLIKNDTIRISIQSLYEGYFPRLDKSKAYTPDISSAWDSYYLNEFTPNTNMDLRFYFELPDDTVGSKVYSDVSYEFPYTQNRYGKQSTIGYIPLDFDRLKQDHKFLMLLDQTRRYREYKLRHYNNVKNTIKLAIHHIEKELEFQVDEEE